MHEVAKRFRMPCDISFEHGEVSPADPDCQTLNLAASAAATKATLLCLVNEAKRTLMFKCTRLLSVIPMYARWEDMCAKKWFACGLRSVHFLDVHAYQDRFTKGPLSLMVEPVCQMIRNKALRPLQVLNLEKNGIGEPQMKTFAAVFNNEFLPFLDTLSLNNNPIGNHLFLLFESTTYGKTLPPLTALNVQRIGIEKEGMVLLATFLRLGVLPFLEVIGFKGNPIGNEGLWDFVNGVSSPVLGPPSSLLMMDFRSINVDVWDFVDGVSSLVLGPPSSLTMMDFRSINVDDSGIEKFAKLVRDEKRLPSLIELQLGFNNISRRGQDALARAIREGALRSLKYLHVTDVDPDGELPEACARRKIVLNPS